ncbi:MAG: prolyl oligopeptidase family serine peptidase [Caldimonas sp.]
MLNRLLFALVCLSATLAANAAPERLPLDAFFNRARLVDARLSPSGQWLAITAAAGTGRVSLAVVDTAGKTPPVVTATFSNADVRSFRWVNDDRLVFNVIDLASGGQEQRFGPGLFSVRRDGSELRRLIASLHGDAGGTAQSLLDVRHELLDVPVVAGNTVLVGEYVLDSFREVDSVNAKRLDVVTGRVESLSFDRPAHARQWLFDPQGEPRAIAALHRGQTQLYWRAPGQAGWARFASFPTLAAPFELRFVDSQGQLYVSVPDGIAGTDVLKRFDFASGAPAGEAIVRTPGFDVSGTFLVDARDARVVGVRTTTDATATVWYAPRMNELQAVADRKLPGRVNALSCSSCQAPEVVLVHSWSDQDPGSFWLYRPASDAWDLIGKVRPEIEPAAMGRLDLHRIKARDGRDLPVWVTTPPASAGPGRKPAVVLVHGGPWVRGNEWEWRADAQFLASRGYVVIEPEFRGSTGYGRAHFEAGWKHWGDTMQDDLADAAKWAASSGLVDDKRVCIAGASYGGYATLMSLVRHPQAYRCGVAWVAVSDPRLLYNEDWSSDSSAEARRFGLPTLLGDLEKDAAMLRRSAPVERAGEIRAPLLLAFGRDDRRVPIEHGNRMREVLGAAGRPPEWVVYEGEGHGWLKTENQLDFWRRVEAFLAKNLK